MHRKDVKRITLEIHKKPIFHLEALERRKIRNKGFRNLGVIGVGKPVTSCNLILQTNPRFVAGLSYILIELFLALIVVEPRQQRPDAQTQFSNYERDLRIDGL